MKKRYSIIYADPPWAYKDNGCQGAAAKHYNTMSIEELKKLPISDLADKNAVLFLWATYPKLAEALELIASWGFIYKTIAFQWVKTYKSGFGEFLGLGRWTRGNTEPCLLATKGKPTRINPGISQLIFSPIRKHSQKPPETLTEEEQAVKEKIERGDEAIESCYDDLLIFVEHLYSAVYHGYRWYFETPEKLKAFCQLVGQV